MDVKNVTRINIGKNSEEQQRGTYSKLRNGNRSDKSSSGEGTSSNRFDRRILSAEEGENLGGKIQKEAVNLLRRDAGADVFAQQEKLVKWATENDKKGYFYNRDDHEKLKETWQKDENGNLKRIGGTESDVFPDHKNNRVIKVTNYSAINKVTPLDFLNDRITWYNRLFPDSAYKLIGIMNYRDIENRDNDIFRFVLEQPFIKGKKMTREEIDKKMTGMGFKKGRLSSQYYLELENGRFLKLTDALIRNFIKEENGDIVCIDPVIRESDEIDNIKA